MVNFVDLFFVSMLLTFMASGIIGGALACEGVDDNNRKHVVAGVTLLLLSMVSIITLGLCVGGVLV